MSECSETIRMVQGLENGTMEASDAFNIADKIDPLLLYFGIRYLREMYPPTNPAATGVIQRLVELTGTYPAIVKKAKEGEVDPITEWFDESYSIREYRDKPDALIEMIYEKMES